ncbi:hypothetical protein [Pseudomonas rubra]|uniref:Uncharacterized protein n=1 Tax=Pseudomonas rubra TaxID=2942627 RepID=A0ABT5P1N5_9PSED|nr:hypothetical protein [Pseudomonas rubra]MDD1012181.1 hypothetical protein [Pseudomonas rubra]MDD1038383.1 hypothetical protein [Pseudomonas rubra]MDD1153420.1 hypothetical protein [Pseudomonas rubra]
MKIVSHASSGIVPAGASAQRESIAEEIAVVNRLKDPSAQIAGYEKILSGSPEGMLSGDEIADVHWNKALAHTEESEKAFNDARQPVTAHRHLEMAIEHMESAKALYGSADNREAAEQQIDQISGSKEKVISFLEGLVAIPVVQERIEQLIGVEPQPLEVYQSGRHPHR